jgi:hypothetical protein
MSTTPPEPKPQAEPPAGSDPGDRSTDFTRERRAALDLRSTDQDRTLVAVHSLEAALAAPASKRGPTWRDDVRAAVGVLYDATAEEEGNAAAPDSILSDIARTQPRLRTRVRGLRAQYRQVCDTIDTLQRELGQPDIDPDVADLRQRVAWLLGSLRHQRARESDLIYEAYYEAFQRDLETDAEEAP